MIRREECVALRPYVDYRSSAERDAFDKAKREQDERDRARAWHAFTKRIESARETVASVIAIARRH